MMSSEEILNVIHVKSVDEFADLCLRLSYKVSYETIATVMVHSYPGMFEELVIALLKERDK